MAVMASRHHDADLYILSVSVEHCYIICIFCVLINMLHTQYVQVICRTARLPRFCGRHDTMTLPVLLPVDVNCKCRSVFSPVTLTQISFHIFVFFVVLRLHVKKRV